MNPRPIITESRQILEQKARSFRWAAQFLAPEVHDDAALLYAFCRLVDDLADEAPTLEQAHHDLLALEQELTGARPPSALIAAFLEMAARRNLDLSVACELVVGVRSDLAGVRMPNDVELLRYCYRVAGTVGLMMCAVLGVEEEAALPFAVDLGVAMQLTNICRDVAEDARMGRVYLPETRLVREGLSSEDLFYAESLNRDALSRVVTDLLMMADWYYRSADEGLRYIPSRSRFAILVASRVYRAIGVQLLERGADPMQGRTIVHWRDKTLWVAQAMREFASPRMLGFAAPPKHDGQLHLALEGLPGAAPQSLF